MSSTSNVQNLLVNVVRPTYKWEAGTGFVPSVTLSNVTELIAGRVQTSALVVSDSNVNTFIGKDAGSGAVTSSNNVGIGFQAMGGIVNANSNVAVGALALDGFSNGSNNTVIGAGADITSPGTSNIILGTNTTITSGSNSIVIGNGITWNQGNYINLGSALYSTNGKVGIGTVAPSQPLDVSGLAYFRDKVGIQVVNPTYSLDVLGTAYATTRFLTGAGSTPAVPAYSFSNVPTTGVYQASDASYGTGALGVSISGAARVVVASNKTYIYGDLDVCGAFSSASGGGGGGGGSGTVASNGTAAAPSFTFSNDLSTGLHLGGTSYLAFDTSGVQRMCISGAFVGIGTPTPRVTLDVSGDISANVYNGPGGTQSAPHYTFSDDRTTGVFFPGANIVGFTAGGTERMRISNANIGIGTTAPTNALDVSGTLRVIGRTGNITFSNGTIDVSGTQIVSTTGAFVNALTTSNSLGGVVLNNGSLRTDPSDGFLVAVGSGTNTITYSSDHGTTWTGLGTSIFSSIGYEVAWNGSLWVAVGQGTNSIAYSADGSNWTGLGTSIFSTAGIGIGWNGSLWVATGEGTNTLAYSADGSNWTGLGTSIFSTRARTVAWNGSRWVAGGLGTNGLATSTDGSNWTGLGTNVLARGVAWNGTRWVAVGSGSNVAYSDDGITWTAATHPFTAIAESVAWNGRLWVAGTNGGLTTIATSTDGITWTDRGTGGGAFSSGLYGVAWSGTQWVGVGGGPAVATSPDGITWTNVTSPFSTQGWNIASRRHILPLVRQAGLDISTTTTLTAAGAIVGANRTALNFIGGVTLSANDISMNSAGRILAPIVRNALTPTTYDISAGNISNSGTTRSSNFISTVNTASNQLGGITLSNGILRYTLPTDGFVVATGEGTNTLAYSSDHGTTWTGLGTSIFSIIGYGVAWNGVRWVACGNGSANTLAYSSDGITWTGNGKTIFSGGSRGVAWSGTRWVAVGNGTNSIAYSSDGITWTGIGTSIFTTGGNGVAWNGSLFVAVGDGTNAVATSPDGITWTGRVASSSSYGTGVAWNGSLWVVTGVGGSVAGVTTSPDGITWTSRTTSGSTIAWAVAWNGSKWVVGAQGTTNIYTSDDGITWTGQSDAIGNPVLGVAWTGTLWVAAGSPGGGNSIQTSSDGTSWTGRGGSLFTTTGWGVASERYVLPVIADTVTDISSGTIGLSGKITTLNAAATHTIATTTFTNRFVGILTTSPAYALDICGTVRALEGLKQGTNTWGSYSDRRVKHDIHTADTSLCYSIIKRLPLKRFTWDISLLPTIKDKTSVGWIAQDVEQVFPRAVAKTTELGMDDLRVLDVDQIYKTMYGALEKVIADKEALEAKFTKALARIAVLETALDISYTETAVDVSSTVLDVSGASLQSSESTQPTLPTPPPPEEPPASEPAPQPQPSSEYAPAPAETEA